MNAGDAWRSQGGVCPDPMLVPDDPHGRFADTVGTTPIKYLTSWRMELAAVQLLESDDTLADVADDVGYESETAFSKAFKRHVGMPPATWRRHQRLRAAG